MRILYLSQYFPPEVGATQSRSYDMARCWSSLGHEITMLTEFPNHPSGIIPASYKGKIFERTTLDEIHVIRVWIKTSPRKNFLNRMLFYLSYMINAIIAGLILVNGKIDFIYATSPPLFVGGAALILSAIKRIPFVFEVRDLWPESAIALGELSNQRAISWANSLETACYRKALQIVVVTKGIYNHLLSRGIPSEKIIVIPNGANTDLFAFKPAERDRIRQELGYQGKFVAIYAGIHGLAQGLDIVIKAAQLLQDRQEIHFLFIGEGPKKEELQSLASKYDLKNLTFLPEKSRQDIPAYLSAADIALVPLRKAEIFTAVLPSKIFDAWACEKPVLISIDGEARELVEGVNGGIYIPPDDPIKLAEALTYFMNIPDELIRMGKNGRKFTEEHHSRFALGINLITHLEKYFIKNTIP
jgi:colanic acid biosynthesis glycosyl transferase WcaI